VIEFGGALPGIFVGVGTPPDNVGVVIVPKAFAVGVMTPTGRIGISAM
jgi:hypothetical protein